MHEKWSPSEIQTTTHGNLIGRSKTTPPFVLSPSSILPPPASHCAFTAVRKISVRVDKNVIFVYFSKIA
jgi:hypothetical protein